MCTSIPSKVVTRATRIYSLRGSVGSVCSGRVHHVGPTSTSTSTSSHTLPPQSSPWVINNYSSQPCRGVLHAVPSLRHRGTPTVSIIKQAGYFFFFLPQCEIHSVFVSGLCVCVFWAQSEPRCKERESVWMKTSERDGPPSVMSGEVNRAELSFIHKANRDCAVNGNKCVMIYLQLFVSGHAG